MLKTNRFKTLLVLLSTVLGLTGVTTNVYADKSSDKRIVANMALTFAKHSLYTLPSAFDWADKNTTGRAFEDPYRNTSPGRNVLLSYNRLLDSGPNAKYTLEKLDIKGNRATTIVRIFYSNNLPLKGYSEIIKKQKVWFKKINNKWKISDYYLLLVSEKVNGQEQNSNDHQFYFGAKLFDSKGNKFPY